MDRVWQLEAETFEGKPGFVFARVTDLVEPQVDPTALHPEIQRQTANIRTDLDRFSPLEISCLIRHGYAVARKACGTRPDLFGSGFPAKAPWDPIPQAHGATFTASAVSVLTGRRRAPASATVEARTLQASAQRRIWSTLWDFRDWASYVYVPFFASLIFLVPYLVVKA
jgi:hypothetical protein